MLEPDPQRQPTPYPEATDLWERLEAGDDRYPYPRKDYALVTQLVHAQNDNPNAVSRATQYFDAYPVWLLRAEAYQHLADELCGEQAAELARAVYEFSHALLADAPMQATDDQAGEFGTLRFDNILTMLSWAIAKTNDHLLIAVHHAYLDTELRADLAARGYSDGQIDHMVAYFKNKFGSNLG